MYNDAVFGSVSWSKDETKVVFVAEKVEPASYKNYWEDPDTKAKKKLEGEEEKKNEEEKEPPVYMDEKYKYQTDFGETLVGKKRPGLFVFDITTGTL